MRGCLFLRVGLFLRDLRSCITADIQDCLSQSGLVIYLCFRKRERSLPENHLWHNWKLNYLNSSQTLLPMILLYKLEVFIRGMYLPVTVTRSSVTTDPKTVFILPALAMPMIVCKHREKTDQNSLRKVSQL